MQFQISSLINKAAPVHNNARWHVTQVVPKSQRKNKIMALSSMLSRRAAAGASSATRPLVASTSRSLVASVRASAAPVERAERKPAASPLTTAPPSTYAVRMRVAGWAGYIRCPQACRTPSKTVAKCLYGEGAELLAGGLESSSQLRQTSGCVCTQVVEIGGNQIFVEEGKWYNVNRLDVDVGSEIKLGRVLALKEGGKFTAGRPYVENATVEAKLLEDCRGPKLIVYKMKPKKHYRRTRGHR